MLRLLSIALAAGTAILSTAASSLAADMAAPVETTYQAPNWTGFYVGVHGGMASGSLGYVLPSFPSDLDYSFSDEDALYGIHGGFDYQFSSRWVAGLELDYTKMSLPFSPFNGGLNNPIAKVKSSYSITGRVGYLVTPETLFYGRLGYASISMEAEEGFIGTASGSVGATKAGIGAETFLFDNVTARIEANYVDASKAFVTADSQAFDPKYLVVNAGLSYRFGAKGGSAHAAEPAPAMQFSGFYAGGFGAFSFAQSTLEVIDNPVATTGPFASDALGFGGFVGYDFLINDMFVVGAEAEAAYVNAKFEDPSMNSFATGATTLFGTLKATYAVSARVGVVATPSTLVYAKGGFAGMVMDANEDFFALENGGTKTLSAYQVGAGIESALSEKLTLRIEGVYTKATDEMILGNSQTEQVSIKPSLLTGRIGLAYRF
jgi:opacity protein-like surface antigen